MNSYQQSISTFSICANAYQTFTAIRRPILELTIFAIFLPIILSELILARVSQPTVTLLKTLSEQLLSYKETPNFRILLEASSQFFSPCAVIIFLLLFVISSAYLGLIKIAIAHHAYQKLPSAFSSFIWGARQFFPKGLFLLLVFVFFSFEHFMWGPFRIFSMLILMAPVLYVAEGYRARLSIGRALFLKYLGPSSTGFNVAFTLIVFGAIVFFCETLIGIGTRSLLNLDQWIGLHRDFWTLRFFDFPFSWVFLLVNLLASFAFSLVIASLPLFTVALYYRANGKLS